MGFFSVFFLTLHQPFLSPSSDHAVSTVSWTATFLLSLFPCYHLTSFILFLGFLRFCAFCFYSCPSPLSPWPRGGICNADLPWGKVQQLYSMKKKREKNGTWGRHHFFFFTEKMTISELVPRISVSSDAWRLFLIFILEKQRLDPCIFPHCWDAFSMQHQRKTSFQHCRFQFY